MANSPNEWDVILKAMMRGGGQSYRGLSARLGKSATYVNGLMHNYRNGNAPSADILADIAAGCGYEVHVIGHGQDFLIRPRFETAKPSDSTRDEPLI